MVKKLTIGERIEKLRKSQTLTQEEFAAELGSSSGRISEWESGVATPSAEGYVKLAAQAAKSDPDEAFFFWTQAGLQPDAVISVADVLLKKGEVKMDAILATAEDKLKERMEDQKMLEDKGKVVLVPPYPEDITAAKQAPPPLAVPSFLISHRATTYYTTVLPRLYYRPAGVGLSAQDIIVFDAFDRSLQAVLDSLGEEWLACIPEREESTGRLFLGRAGLFMRHSQRHLALGPLDQDPSGWQPVTSATGSGELFTAWGDRFVELARFDHAREEYVPLKGRQVLGRFIARFSQGALEYWKQRARRE